MWHEMLLIKIKIFMTGALGQLFRASVREGTAVLTEDDIESLCSFAVIGKLTILIFNF
jgi:hypothetical protein